MPEEEGDGVRDFFRNALKQHEMRNKIENMRKKRAQK